MKGLSEIRLYSSSAYSPLKISGILIVLFTIFEKICIDYFIWSVSSDFGIYGVDLKGVYFSENYWVSWIVLFFSAISLVFYSQNVRDPFDVALLFVYFGTAIPVVSLYWIRGAGLEYLLYFFAFWIALFSLLAAMPIRRRAAALLITSCFNRDPLASVYASILFAMFLFFLVLVPGALEYGFGFDTVYDRRRIFGEALGAGGLVYLVSWSAYVFVIYLVFFVKSVFFKLFALGYIALLFGVSGDKIYIFLLLMVAFIEVVSRNGRVWWIPAGIGLACVFASLLYQIGDVWVASIVHRFITMNADISFKSAEFFQGAPQYYAYSFMSPFFAYDYSDIPSRLIGSTFYTEGDNATAGFLADAYVNLGLLGLIPVLGFFIGLRLLLLNSNGLLLVVPLFVQITDTPLPTALLTGGGGIMLLNIYLVTRRAKRCHID